ADLLALVDGAVAVVVDAVADLGARLHLRHAGEHAVAALLGAGGADAGFAGVAVAAAAGAGDALDAGEQVLEVVVAAREEILPAEVEGLRIDAAVHDDEVDVAVLADVVVVVLALGEIEVTEGGRVGSVVGEAHAVAFGLPLGGG